MLEIEVCVWGCHLYLARDGAGTLSILDIEPWEAALIRSEVARFRDWMRKKMAFGPPDSVLVVRNGRYEVDLGWRAWRLKDACIVYDPRERG